MFPGRRAPVEEKKEPSQELVRDLTKIKGIIEEIRQRATEADRALHGVQQVASLTMALREKEQELERCRKANSELEQSRATLSSQKDDLNKRLEDLSKDENLSRDLDMLIKILSDHNARLTASAGGLLLTDVLGRIQDALSIRVCDKDRSRYSHALQDLGDTLSSLSTVTTEDAVANEINEVEKNYDVLKNQLLDKNKTWDMKILEPFARKAKQMLDQARSESVHPNERYSKLMASKEFIDLVRNVAEDKILADRASKLRDQGFADLLSI